MDENFAVVNVLYHDTTVQKSNFENALCRAQKGTALEVVECMLPVSDGEILTGMSYNHTWFASL